MNSNRIKQIDSLERKTLLDLVEQSFSVKGLSESQAFDIAQSMVGEADAEQAFDIPQFKQGGNLKVYLTHDVDWLNPHHPYSILKSCIPGSKWFRLSQLGNKNMLLDNLEKFLAFERKENITSIFHLGAASKTFGRFGLRYHYQSPFLKECVQLLQQHHVKIGLHSVANESLSGQHTKLSKLINDKISFHRSHFLKFDPSRLYTELNHVGIKLDFSSGYARQVGFKRGLSKHYKAIDFVQKKITGVFIIPTVLFDNAFFFSPKEKVLMQFENVIQKAKEYNTAIAILFHPENMLINPALWECYHEIIHICKTENAIFNPAPESL